MNDLISASSTPAHRYAAYYAPAIGSDWWDFGSHWLGRCAATGEIRAQPGIHGVAPELQSALTAAPRRYGWHATLKAPFTLASRVSAEMLQEGIDSLSRTRDAFELPVLKVVLLDDFLALVPTTACAQLDSFANSCVVGLHTFAASLSPAELARRRAKGLDEEEEALLLRWGYPFVLHKFRFHMSLTGSLRGVSPEIIAALTNAAQRAVNALPRGSCDAISLFAEPMHGGDFLCLTQTRLGT